MNEQYLHNRIRLGWAFLAAGALFFAAGLGLQFVIKVPFNARIISGLGIFLFGLGLAQLVRYRAVRRDSKTAARVVNEERDERSYLIRARAGLRGFWVSLAMTYAALMWLSFASNGSLPTPSLDELWFYLAGAVIVPFAVFGVSIVFDQKNG
jgi:hypothetical protein